jgi:hypothetical protein
MVIGHSRDDVVGTWAVKWDFSNDDVAPVDDADPFVDLLVAIGERWSQLTFFLFNAEGWR